MPFFRPTAGLILAAAALLGPADARAWGQKRPNIVLIVADDLGWGDVGYQGRDDWRTPRLDQLASRGATLPRCYSSAPICGPSRAGLLTGKAPSRIGVRGNSQDLPRAETTLAEALGPLGYRSAAIGKWHQGKVTPAGQGDGPSNPLDQGFGTFLGFLDTVHAWEKFPKTLCQGRDKIAVSGYADDLFTDHAIEFLREPSDAPFFLYLAYTAPHFNIEAPADEVALHLPSKLDADPSRPTRATYAAMITRLDRNVGRVLDELEAQGRTGETIVVFTSDNGATFESGNLGTSRALDSNRPFRGQKRTLWEGGVRVPGLIVWPGHIPAGSTLDAPASHLDLFPTLVAAAGGDTPAGNVDGIDLLPALTGAGTPLPDRPIFWEWRQEGTDQTAVLVGRSKLIALKDQRPELYDVVSDPSERLDRASEDQETVETLQELLDEWLTDVGAIEP
jgi:arylsulfatase A-like enzyme